MQWPHILSLGVLVTGFMGCGVTRTPVSQPERTPAPAAPSAPTKVGFVYVTPIETAGWTYQHDLGRRDMEVNLGGRVSTQIAENVPEGPEAEQVIRQQVKDGCKIIFTTSFGYMNQTARAAADAPSTLFFHATGFKTQKNMGVYNARFYEGRYLCGVIAGRMTKTHVAGYVASFPIPEVVQGINAFTQGMRSVDPKASVKVVWVNSWFDPEKEKEATLSLLSQNADMVTHHTDSTVVVQTVEAQHRTKDVWSFSFHSDMSKYGPHSALTGCVHFWGDFYTQTVREILAGKWNGTRLWGGIREGMVKLAPLHPAIPQDVKEQVADLQAKIAAGTLHPFAGPLIAQDGTLKVPAGSVITDGELAAMNYYTQGVISNLK